MTLRNAILTAAFWCVATAAAAAPGVTVMLDRTEEAMGLYLRMPATAAEPLFGRAPEGMTVGGIIDIDAMREGTYEAGDAMFADVATTTQAGAIVFEALSVAVNRPTAAIPFEFPIDGDMAIAVCLVPDPGEALTFADVDLFAGFYAYPTDGYAALAVRFPETGRDTLTVTVREFRDGDLIDVRSVALADGGTLDFAAPRRAPGAIWVLSLLFGTVMAGGLAQRVVRRRRI
ncbi:MAG: hypothetical protein AAF281_07025 [Pseudomonadota bacterium]